MRRVHTGTTNQDKGIKGKKVGHGNAPGGSIQMSPGCAMSSGGMRRAHTGTTENIGGKSYERVPTGGSI
jgi:hypothetical protein